MVYIQRSRGYSLRHSISIDEIEKIATLTHRVSPDTVVMTDNCYGEFTEKKRAVRRRSGFGGRLAYQKSGRRKAPCGGYIVGRHDLVEDCAYRMTTPGLGREVGATLGTTRSLYMGLFFFAARNRRGTQDRSICGGAFRFARL